MTGNKEKKSIETNVAEICESLAKEGIGISVRKARKRMNEVGLKLDNATLTSLVNEWRRENEIEYEVKPSEMTLKAYAADVMRSSEALTSDIRQKNEDLRDDLDDLLNKYNEKEAELDDVIKKLEKATEKTVQLERENASIELRLAQQATEIERLLSELSVVTKERDRAKAADSDRQLENATLRNEVKSANELLLVERLQKEAAQENEKALRAELTACRGELSSVNMRAGTAEGQILGLNETIRVLSDQVKQTYGVMQYQLKLKGMAS